MRRVLPLALLLAGCPTGDDDDSAAVGSTTELSVVTTLDFAEEEPEGFSTAGFNLDGFVSTPESDTCGVGDLVHVESGEEGIDNSFGASLLPALRQIGGQAVEDLVKNAILDGELLVMIELSELDDRINDDCVGVEVSRGSGRPMIGGDGAILPDQTYDQDLERPISTVECAVLTDGVLRASPFSLQLPLSIFDESIDITLLDGVLEVELLGDGVVSGTIAGGVDIQDIKDNVAGLDGIGDQIPALIGPLLDINADLAPTNLGTCTQLSVALSYEGVGAWFYED